jgi:hypothetical protein
LESRQEILVEAWYDRFQQETTLPLASNMATGIQANLIAEKARNVFPDYGINQTLLVECEKNFRFFLENLTGSRTQFGFDMIMKIKILSESGENGKAKLANLPDYLSEEILALIKKENFQIAREDKEKLEKEINRMSIDCHDALDNSIKKLEQLHQNEIQRGVLNNIPPEYSCPSGFVSEITENRGR